MHGKYANFTIGRGKGTCYSRPTAYMRDTWPELSALQSQKRTSVSFLPLHAIAMERYCHRMASGRLSVRLSVCNVDDS